MTNYPDALDTDLELPRVDANITEIGGDAINAIRDAIFAIESSLGINPQGDTASLASRINSVIDADGNIKTSALSGIGLITLPINNSHIDAAAAIAESKLDLDYTTSFLKGRSDSNATNISAIQTNFSSLNSTFITHFLGTANRHDGYQIDLNVDIQSVSTVEAALHNVDNLLVDHISSSIAHSASSITASGIYNNVTIGDVQAGMDALSILNPRITQHQDEQHHSAIALNYRGETDKYGNLQSTTFASTIYQTNTALPSTPTNILQVMRPNVARITGEQPDLRALDAGTAFNIRVQAGGVDRSILNLDISAAIPTENIDNIIEELNSSLHSDVNHYPVSAYNTDGRITFAHHIPGEQFSIQILAGSSNSAHTALGFGNLTNNVYYGQNQADAYYTAYLGTERVAGIKPLLQKTISHGGGATIDPSVVDLNALGITTTDEGRILCYITEHSSDNTANGTYYIINFPTTDTFTLNASIASGTFNVEIAADSVNFIDTARGEVYDIFLENDADGYSTIVKELRMDYVTLSGVSIKDISKDFPTDNISWSITNNDTLRLREGSNFGNSVNIPTNFIGELKVFAPDNINSMLFDVSAAPSSGTNNINVYEFAGSNERIYLSSVHHAGIYTSDVLKFVSDKRQLGGAPENQYKDRLEPSLAQDTFKELRNNGVIRGFDIISNTTTTIRVRGGRILIDGQILDIPTQDVTIDSFTDADRLLALDRNGNYQTFDGTEAGYSFAELTAGDGYGDDRGLVPISIFGTTATELDGTFTDIRLLINKLDKRVKDNIDTLNSRISQVESVVGMWGFTIAASTEMIDAYVGNISISDNPGFSYVDEPGFAAGNGTITTRRYEFDEPDAYTIFIGPGISHINIMAELDYTGTATDGPFGVSGPVTIQLGVAATRGQVSTIVTESYATIKSLVATTFPDLTVRERYVASIPLSNLGLNSNTFIDFVPRIKITGSTSIDGGTVPIDTSPIIYFGKIRMVTASYSIAGNISGQDGSATALGIQVGGEIL